MIQYIKPRPNSEPLETSRDFLPNSWVRVERPAPAETDIIRERFGLDQDILTDALDPHEIPRIESDTANLYIITRLPDTDDDFNDFTTPILFVLHSEHLVTVSRDSLARLWEPYIAAGAMTDGSHILTFTSMMDAIIEQYVRRVAAINRQMRAVSADITLLRPRDISIFVEYERKLNDYVDALIPSNAAIEKILSQSLVKLTPAEQDAVDNLSIELEQIIARCKSLLRTITNVRDSFRAVMDTRLNETIRLLTVITVALTVPTMIAGLFGMNVDLPGPVEAPYMFWWILFASLAASAILVFYFLQRRR